jgi:catalase
VLFDAMVLPDGAEGVAALGKDGHTLEFLKDQYRHCKTIVALGESVTLLERAGISSDLPTGEMDLGLIIAATANEADPPAFIEALANHRHPARDRDPPLI